MGLRDLAQALAPPWLSDDSPGTPDNPPGGVGGRLLYLLGLVPDATVDKMQQAIYARLPLGGTSSPSGGNGGPDQDAVSLIGADRVIIQGLGEPPAAYGKRLQRAFPTWQHAGQAITVMQEVLAYLQTKCKIMVLADANAGTGVGPASAYGYATSFAAGADPSLPPSRWKATWAWEEGYGALSGGAYPTPTVNAYDGHPAAWDVAVWRDWLVLWAVAPYAWTSAAPTIGSPTVVGDPALSIGFNTPHSVFATIQILVRTWRCANTWYRWIIVSLDADFADWSSGTAYYPTSADWEHWSKIDTAVNPDGDTVPAYVPSRADNLRYCDGVL